MKALLGKFSAIGVFKPLLEITEGQGRNKGKTGIAVQKVQEQTGRIELVFLELWFQEFPWRKVPKPFSLGERGLGSGDTCATCLAL